MMSGLLLYCLVAIATANPVPIQNETEPYQKHGVQDIVNGVDAEYGRFKSILSLKDNGFHVCGAALISSTRALTAAHCVEFSGTYTVVAGELNFDRTSGYEVSRAVKEIILHDRYDTKTLVNDIAVLKFEAIPLGTYIKPIEMVKTGSLVNEKCLIAGWGKTSGHASGASRMLKFAEVNVMKNKDCNDHFKGVRGTEICVERFDKNVSACSGDSGGPLTCRVKGVTKLAGVTSSGGEGCTGSKPSIYTRISKYQKWIKKNI